MSSLQRGARAQLGLRLRYESATKLSEARVTTRSGFGELIRRRVTENRVLRSCWDFLIAKRGREDGGRVFHFAPPNRVSICAQERW
jgi:hypothetical protein